MLHYIIQTVGFQLFFLIIYDVFLTKETFFNWNRAYLLLTAALSVVLPFVKIDQFREVIPEQFIINLPEIILGKLNSVNSNMTLGAGTNEVSGFMFSWQLLLFIGATIAFILFVYKLIKIALLIFKNPKRWQGNLRIVKLINSNAAFSFFYYVFLGDSINTEDKAAVLKHESIHVNQKHTVDLLMFELLRIVFWFNPLIYMYQNRVTILHEYIADAKAVKSQGKKQYYENLLTQVFETENVSFINSFFKQSLIKKRIIMLSKTKSNQSLKIKYALLIPMVFGMLVYTSCTQENNQENQIDALDLSQYSYKVKKGEGTIMSKETSEIHSRYEAFLMSNPNYVSWAEHTEEESNYSVHHKDEKIPDNMEESKVRLSEGTSYIMYINWQKKTNSQNKTEKEEIPFAIIDNVPVYPGCEDLLTNKERRKCMANKISSFVQEKFNIDLAGDLGLIGKQRISVVFKIDKEGNIIGVKSRAPHPKLEEEAIRIISSLPKMEPGKQKGKNVIVPYSLPIIFMVAE